MHELKRCTFASKKKKENISPELTKNVDTRHIYELSLVQSKVCTRLIFTRWPYRSLKRCKVFHKVFKGALLRTYISKACLLSILSFISRVESYFGGGHEHGRKQSKPKPFSLRREAEQSVVRDVV